MDRAIRVVEEHSSWWDEPCNTSRLTMNEELMIKNSKGVIQSEIEDLQRDIDFLHKIQKIVYSQAWEVYREQVQKDMREHPFEKKPVCIEDEGAETGLLINENDLDFDQMDLETQLKTKKMYPSQLYRMDELIKEMKLELGKLYTLDDNRAHGYIRSFLKKEINKMLKIDEEMQKDNYTFNGINVMELYDRKYAEVKKYINKMKAMM